MIQIDAMLLKIKNIKNIIPQIFIGLLPPANEYINSERESTNLHP